MRRCLHQSRYDGHPSSQETAFSHVHVHTDTSQLLQVSLLLPLLAQTGLAFPFPEYKGPTAMVAGFGVAACVKTASKDTLNFMPENQCRNATSAFSSLKHSMVGNKPGPSGTVSHVQGYSEPGCQAQVVVRRGDRGPCLDYTASAGGQSLIFSCVPDNSDEKSGSLGEL